MKLTNFAHLHNHSVYSLKDSVARIKEFLTKAKEDGQTSVAITDHGNLYGHIEFYQEAKALGINPVIGNEFYICDNHLDKGEAKKGKKKKEEENSFLEGGKEAGPKRDRYHITVLAQNNIGYKNLLKLTTISNMAGFYYKPRIDKNLLRQYREGLIVLSGCLGSEINQYILNDMYQDAERVIQEYLEIFGKNFYLEVMNHFDPLEDKVREIVPKFAKKYGIKIVATNDCHYVEQKDSLIQDAIIALRDNKTLDNPSLKVYRNNSYYFKTRQEMADLFKDNLEYLENAHELAESCKVEIIKGKMIFPEFISGDENKKKLLRDLCVDGYNRKIKPIIKTEDEQKKYGDRVKYESGVICKNGFADYFLIISDIVKFAKRNKIPCGFSRGSVGGSLVSYLTDITEVNPIKYGLYFSRFLNEGRISPPDIDLDFADNRRDEIIQYIRNKYGSDKFAKVLTFGNFQMRSALKDAFRVYGHDLSLQNEVTKLIPDVIQGIPELKFSHVYGLDPRFPEARQDKLLAMKEKYPNEFYLAEKLEDNPRHVSTHASAYVLTDKDISEYVPLDLDTKTGDSRIGVDMYSGEYINLLKIDLLGIETLSIVDNALKSIGVAYGKELDIYNLDEEDEKTWSAFKKADTIGVFQFESDGMRGLLKKAKPRDIEELAQCNALYRPGASSFIGEYCMVKSGAKKQQAFHELMEPVLEETFGVLIYQESVMKMCQVLAGFSESDADYMRKAIGKKLQKDMEVLMPKFSEGCKKNGIDEKLVNEILDWFSLMSRYNFNKSHAVGYSKTGYVSAYLKTNYPFEFFVSMFNKKTKELDDYNVRYTDALKHGVRVNGPHINNSMEECDYTIDFDDQGEEVKKIYFGLNLIKGVSSDAVASILKERASNGDFKNSYDFLLRTFQFLDKNTIEGLAKSGALDPIGAHRKILIDNSDELIKIFKKVKARLGKKVPGENLTIEDIASFLDSTVEMPAKERLLYEKEVTGFYCNGNPLEEFKKKLLSDEYTNMSEVATKENGEFIRIGGIISSVEERQDKNKNQMAFVEIEDSYGKIRGIVFASQYIKYRPMLNKKDPLEISGRLSNNVVIVNSIKRLKNDD